MIQIGHIIVVAGIGNQNIFVVRKQDVGAEISFKIQFKINLNEEKNVWFTHDYRPHYRKHSAADRGAYLAGLWHRQTKRPKAK